MDILHNKYRAETFPTDLACLASENPVGDSARYRRTALLRNVVRDIRR